VVIESDIPSLLQWLIPSHQSLGAIITFIVMVFLVCCACSLLAYLFVALRQGPSEAFYVVTGVIRVGLSEWAQTSPRRVYAMAKLAVQEAIRRKILIVFAMFFGLLLFAGWFLDVRSDHPAEVYLSVVLTVANFLVILIALFLSTFSLPQDIKHRTIYTVVTKPVRSGEIVLGRIFGFAGVGTVILVVMCLVSYVFVIRGMSHDHIAAPSDPAKSSLDAHHRHEIKYGDEGYGETDLIMDHWHEVTKADSETEPKWEVGPALGSFQARVPIYGKLQFLGRDGRPGDGINVGYEWAYRKYIEGRTGAAAIYRFKDITPENYPDGLPIEMTLSVFRTHKGDIEKGVNGTIELRNPNPTGSGYVRSRAIVFTSREFATHEEFIPRTVRAFKTDNKTGDDIDLFEELAPNGELEIWVQCADPAQFFGMANADVYLRRADTSFFFNFVKCHISMWFQMIIVISFGVMFSTFLNGPVAMLATNTAFTLGYFRAFIVDVVSGKIDGGGPIESLVRLITQNNVMVDLDPGTQTSFIKLADYFVGLPVAWLGSILPNLGDFGTSEFVAKGFSIDFNVILTQGCTTLAFFVCLSIASYFFLKTRELAA
jgi:hypothetical protein